MLKSTQIYSRLKDLHEAYVWKIKNQEDAVLRECYQKRKVTVAKRLSLLEEYAESLSHSIYGRIEEAKNNHDLDSLINSICSIYEIEVKIKELFEGLLPTLEYYRRIDPDGDAFRYWSSVAGKPHFASKGIGTVDIQVLTVHYKHIRMGFEMILSHIEYLSQEYKTGTFTKELSRTQIKEIAQLIPKPHDFSDRIKIVKNEIMDKYGIGSKNLFSIF